MGIAQLKRRIEETKPSELEHLYVDADDQLRDRHIEDMFNTLFYGEPLDVQFQTNFALYARLLLGDDHVPPPEIFRDIAVAKGWINIYFGLCHVSDNVIGETAGDPDLAHCTHRVRLRSRFDPDTDDAYAPSALHGLLLSAVIVYRSLATRWFEQYTR